MTEHTLALEVVMQSIFLLRGQKILLDADLAALYGVATKRLNEQVRRNANRFPADFMFQLTEQEFENLRSQNATSNCLVQRRGGRRYRPLAFTEHGAIMAANVLNSDQAIAVSTYVVRAFVQLRELVVSNGDLAARLGELEHKVELPQIKGAVFEQVTKDQLQQIFEALRALMAPPTLPPKRPIGFLAPADQPTNTPAPATPKPSA